jgi:alcohol dehydrogenase class IV
MWLSLKSLGVSEEEVAHIAQDGQVLPDYKNNPRVATLEEMSELLMASYSRQMPRNTSAEV